MPHRKLAAIVLAAGEGTRMRSPLPKPLHRLCGRPMVLHVLDALAELPIERVVVVVGYRSAEVTKTLQAEAPPSLRLEFVEQTRPLGTGDAAAVALTAFPDGYADGPEEGELIVLPGDTPLLTPATLAPLVEEHRRSEAAATLLTARLEDPTGYGRVLRGKDTRVARIIEQADASEQEQSIDEVSTSIYCFRHTVLAPSLRRLLPNNAQGEYYLTDTVTVLHDAGYVVGSVLAQDPRETAGVNDRLQLAFAEGELRRRMNERLLRAGVTMTDPASTYLDASVRVEEDVTLLPGCVLEGATTIGRGAVIGPHTHLVDCSVGERARVEHSVAVHSMIGDDAVVGPFAHLPAGSRLAPGALSGAFFRAEGTGTP